MLSDRLKSFFGSESSNKDKAKNRLQLMLETNIKHENEPDFMPELKQDIMAVIAKYVKVDPSQLNVEIESEADSQMLKVDLVLPEQAS